MGNWESSLDGQHVESHDSTRRLVCWGTVLVLCIAALLYIALKPLSEPPILPSLPPTTTPSKTASDAAAVRAQFFDDHVQSAIAEADVANRQAADRCVQRLQEAFDSYRNGIQPFTDDLTSWGTRWGVIRRMPSDWWYEKTDIQQFVTQKFEAHLFSAKSLETAIGSTIKQFNDDVDANNNRLLTKIQAEVSRSDLPGLSNISYSDFAADVTTSLKAYSADAATASVKNLILTELASGVAGSAATSIIAAIGTRIAATAAATSAAAGGATAGGAAVGGGGGALGGPATAVVGFGVGLAAGVIVDWWLSSRFEEKLRLQLNEFIDTITSSVIDGTDKNAGIKHSLAETCDALRGAYRQSLYNRIVKESIQ